MCSTVRGELLLHYLEHTKDAPGGRSSMWEELQMGGALGGRSSGLEELRVGGAPGGRSSMQHGTYSGGHFI